MKKTLLVSIMILLSSISIMASEKYYGFELLSKLNTQEFKVSEKNPKFPLRKIYSKKLKGDYFNSLLIHTNNNNIIHKIIVVKDSNSIYTDANQVLNKLKQKYGNFYCIEDSNPLLGKIGDICTNQYNNVKIALETKVWGSEHYFTVEYESPQYSKLIGDDSKASLDKL